MNPAGTRRLALLFAAVVLPTALTVIWLGLRLLQQDRDLFATRVLERQEAAADAVIRSLLQRFVQLEQRLGDPAVADIVILRRTAAGLSVSPADAIAWYPGPAALPEAVTAVFLPAELLEFRGNPAAAAVAYRRLTTQTDAEIRAGALLRLARVHRAAGQVDRALALYEQLTSVTNIAIHGIPADLTARRAISEVLRETGRVGELEVQLSALERDFLAGRWRLDRNSWIYILHSLEEVLGRALAVQPTRIAISDAAATLLSAVDKPAGRLLVRQSSGALTGVWRAGEEGVSLALIPEQTLGSWIQAAADAAAHEGYVAIQDDEGQVVAVVGRPPSGRVVRRAPMETGLPWSVAVAGGGAGIGQNFQLRQRTFAGALAALLLLLGVGSHLLWRTLARELALLRLQAEFVSAVSHEFRTPVTSLRHLIELLQESDELPPDRRQAYYTVLGRSTDRLYRLVESLLDFGRMESGRKPYLMVPVDVAIFVRGVAAEFSSDGAARGYSIEVDITPGTPESIVADRDALGHALWNLLDNAVKYSPGETHVSVRVHQRGHAVAIDVCDRGLGVPAAERDGIFLKFVRGERARTMGIKGTGVGLAIVTHIVRAHGGSVEVESEEGQGSVFRLVLPVTS